MNEKLKSCPFCGEYESDVIIVHVSRKNAAKIYKARRCSGCGAYGSLADTDRKATEKWNNRDSREISMKGKPKRDGSGRGVRANRGRWGCAKTSKTGKGR